MDVDTITPVAQDYLKAIWTATEWGGAPITTGALASRFGTSAANVTDTVRRLAAQGLVEYTPYRPVQLTEDGAAYAVAMVRRHRLIETFLVTALGYGWDEVHTEAERLEHAVSDTLVERIDAFAHLAPAIRSSHERIDGRGYPDGLAGERIPLAARIVAACDTYDAIVTDRPYRAARTPEQARGELLSVCGTQLDERVVSVLLEELAAA